MKLTEFDYNLPRDLIAQFPCERRDGSRLMVVRKITKSIEHRNFRDIAEYLNHGDCLVVNDTKVIKARLPAKRQDTGAKAEILLLEKLSEGSHDILRPFPLYKCLVDTSTKIKVGTKFVFGEDGLNATVRAESDGIRLIEFNVNGGPACSVGRQVRQLIEKFGVMPLPPYIKRSADKSDEERYQTVYAKAPGAIAAPTAGLHFTQEVLERIRAKGASVESVTLHVGYGTFKPVAADDVARRKLEAEYFEIKEEVARRLNEVKENGGKIFAVGTTTLRALEYQARLVKGSKNRIGKGNGWTTLFIYPPYNFKFVDALVTNFHLPKTTLVMLAAAFCGKDFLFEAYSQAVKERYRFYSYGDSMLII